MTDTSIHTHVLPQTLPMKKVNLVLKNYMHKFLRGLPLDMQIKAGKYLVGFGKLNTIHPHAWHFIERPLFHQIFFGGEGFNDIGVNFSFILPTESFYSNLDLGIYKGDKLLQKLKSLILKMQIATTIYEAIHRFSSEG
ncbi:MAG: hypothetical protein MZV64_03260 [Ignavibacteriales bacterium]|nr:hypothetical protein [Ignavibacteriales bacterium]